MSAPYLDEADLQIEVMSDLSKSAHGFTERVGHARDALLRKMNHACRSCGHMNWKQKVDRRNYDWTEVVRIAAFCDLRGSGRGCVKKTSSMMETWGKMSALIDNDTSARPTDFSSSAMFKTIWNDGTYLPIPTRGDISTAVLKTDTVIVKKQKPRHKDFGTW